MDKKFRQITVGNGGGRGDVFETISHHILKGDVVYKAALQINPRHSTTLVNYDRLLVVSNKFSKAQQQFENTAHVMYFLHTVFYRILQRWI